MAADVNRTQQAMSGPMRITMLMASAGSRLGGLETIARELSQGLQARGHHVTLVTGQGPGARLQPDLRNGVAPYAVRTVPMLGQASWLARLAGRLRGIHPSVVESKSFWAAARLSRSIMRGIRGSTVVAAFYEVEAVDASREVEAPFVYYYAGPIDPRRLARGRFTRVVAISRMVADYHAGLDPALKLPGIDGVVNPGVAEEDIAEGPAPGVSAARPEVVFAGRLDETGEKRAAKLIKWWPRVLEAVPNARLTLLGGGTDLLRLRELAARPVMGESVTLPGPLPRARLFARLREASVFAFPSRLETFGIAALEALAAGLPVIASDIPGLRESLGDAALLLSVEDDAAWVEMLIRLLADSELRAEWAAKGPPHARNFRWARQTEAFEAQLREAVRETQSRRSGTPPDAPPAVPPRARKV